MARVLLPLPDRDFDPTEVAVQWRELTVAGHEIVFCTEKKCSPGLTSTASSSSMRSSCPPGTSRKRS
jgi:hypothetical protein